MNICICNVFINILRVVVAVSRRVSSADYDLDKPVRACIVHTTYIYASHAAALPDIDKDPFIGTATQFIFDSLPPEQYPSRAATNIKPVFSGSRDPLGHKETRHSALNTNLTVACR